MPSPNQPLTEVPPELQTTPPIAAEPAQQEMTVMPLSKLLEQQAHLPVASLSLFALKYRLIIFDLDGTLVEPRSGEEFRLVPEDWKFIGSGDDDPLGPRIRALAALKKRKRDMQYAIASNQGGIAAFPQRLPEERMKQQIDIAAKIVGTTIALYSPHSVHDKSAQAKGWRKPGPDMLNFAMRFCKVTAHSTLMVGDRVEDLHAAQNANHGRGVDFMWAWHFFDESVPESVPAIIRAHVTPGITQARFRTERELKPVGE